MSAPATGLYGVLVETSAIAAIALEEPDWRSLTTQVLASDCATTAFNVFEAVLALAKQTAATPRQAHADIVDLLARLSVDVLPFTPDMVAHAVDTRERFGRGRKGLNMGDCLSYAAAKQLGLKLLYKGDDFALTDLSA